MAPKFVFLFILVALMSPFQSLGQREFSPIEGPNKDQKARLFSDIAVEEHNKQANTSLKLDRVIKAEVRESDEGGPIEDFPIYQYRVRFTAFDGKIKKLYEALVSQPLEAHSLKSLAEPREWTPINPGDPEVLNLARYGLAVENQRDSRSLKFVSIVRGQYVEIDDGRPEYVPIIRYKLVISADDENKIRKQYEEVLSESLEASVFGDHGLELVRIHGRNWVISADDGTGIKKLYEAVLYVERELDAKEGTFLFSFVYMPRKVAPKFVFFVIFVFLSSLNSLAKPDEWTPINLGDFEVVNLAKVLLDCQRTIPRDR
ncbi:cysteine proteinase inhibitor [Striga asiatica]|uniref:Cysteine proteinase inhibitor n=1 Tax=Striga asiatica TaxID=4170 RepID=A0A5A7RGQ8_STRAF|nr:cysteine proteinase inhibitor [Striga asiatica]